MGATPAVSTSCPTWTVRPEPEAVAILSGDGLTTVEPQLDDDAVGPRDWNRVQATRFRVASLATWIDRFDVVS